MILGFDTIISDDSELFNCCFFIHSLNLVYRVIEDLYARVEIEICFDHVKLISSLLMFSAVGAAYGGMASTVELFDLAEYEVVD
ncbi:hypothetical protein L1987_81759 [Smallanthus sonchifolius]|uniref:Uncharacterized protein n=1 Tax=Smallanthus sonchifolius TaxID=185202 RepID=A0ACB8YSF7_9ASTR|nr:hypothetical protein L1987_81759 [Smallanthus sonchifolius]